MLWIAISFAVACGGAPPPSPVSRVGEYSGPNELDFLVTSPVQRQMPRERHRGTAVVTADDGARVTIDLRMLEDGDVCHVVAVRSAPPAQDGGDETLAVEAGQDCSSRLEYEGSPVAATVRITEGTVTLGQATMSVRLSGQFVAAVAQSEGTTQIAGVARWQLDARARGR